GGPGSAPDGGPATGSTGEPLTSGGAPVGRTAGCPDRDRQIPNDPYSPPCYAFAGDNGGATVRGVTADEIHISFRQVEAGSAAEIFAGLAGQSFQDSAASTEATLDALAEYFSDRFQFYGRRLKIDRFRGAGNGLNELLGGGKERATADAVRAAQEIGAFAELNAGTLPYADALARNGVVNIGAPYPSRAWFDARAPFSWSLFPDGTNIAEATRSVLLGRFPPGSVAEFAGPGLEGKPRVFGAVVPENPEYQESVAVFNRLIAGSGIQVGGTLKYKLDLVSMPQQASNLVAQLKDAGVTSLLCFCDPAMLAIGMIPKAIEQNYYPEWITAGVVFVDQDIVSQAMDPRQWGRAFGTAYNAESERIGSSYPYAAFKSVRPNDEPAFIVEDLYYQLYLLSIGIQLAGPNLTPETFQAGLFSYQAQTGPRGTWDFGPGDRTPTNDYREVWWDPERISSQNDRRGRWVELNGGRRYRPEDPPSGRAPFFEG
ncbi:MAG: hypothetical protein M3Z03_15540, partial [Actinomycetota bacterium]|nr:hypothetical protein [Actinomycetota bacterium]